MSGFVSIACAGRWVQVEASDSVCSQFHSGQPALAVRNYLLGLQEEMLSCNFTNASQVGPEAVNDTQVTYIVPLHSVMSLYFASQGHCNNTPPLRLSVNVIQPGGWSSLSVFDVIGNWMSEG